MRYVIARTKIENREMAYRFYVTDGLKMIAESSAKIAGGGSIFNIEYRDVVYPKPVEDRTSEDVINSIKNKLNALE